MPAYRPNLALTEVFARGGDGKLIHTYNGGAGWSPWSAIGDWRLAEETGGAE